MKFANIKKNSFGLIALSLVMVSLFLFFQNCGRNIDVKPKTDISSSINPATSKEIANFLNSLSVNEGKTREQTLYETAQKSACKTYGSSEPDPVLIYRYKFINPISIPFLEKPIQSLDLQFGDFITWLRVEPTDSYQIIYRDFINSGYKVCIMNNMTSSSADYLKTLPCPGFDPASPEYDLSLSTSTDSVALPSSFNKIDNNSIFQFTFLKVASLEALGSSSDKDEIIKNRKQFVVQIQRRNASMYSTQSLQIRTVDPYCFVDSKYDSCVYWKNPVASRGSRLKEYLNFSLLNSADDQGILQELISTQLFPINYKSSLIRSSNSMVDITNTFHVYSDFFPSKKSNPLNGVNTLGKMIFGNSNELDRIKVAQQIHYFTEENAFFTLDQMLRSFSAQGGKFWGVGKNIPINSLNFEVISNAYFWASGTSYFGIELGVAESPCEQDSPRSHPMALDSDVLVHEMGHAQEFFSRIESVNGNQNLAEASYFDLPTSEKKIWVYAIAPKDVSKGVGTPFKSFFANQLSMELKSAIYLTYLTEMNLKNQISSEKYFKYPGIYYLPNTADDQEQIAGLKAELAAVGETFVAANGPSLLSHVIVNSESFHGQILITLPDSGCSAKGCSSAISEGIGDTYNWLMFLGKPERSETICNSILGSCSSYKYRSPRWGEGKHLTDYARAAIDEMQPSEPHLIGGFFSKIMWRIDNRIRQIETSRGESFKDFKALFVDHIKCYTPESTFDSIAICLKASIQNMNWPEDKKLAYANSIDEICRDEGLVTTVVQP